MGETKNNITGGMLEQGQWVHIVYRPAAVYTTATAYTAVEGRREGDRERMLLEIKLKDTCCYEP